MQLHVKEMFARQKALDARIEKRHGLTGHSLIGEKLLALYVEVGELANETRCFKFWSLKPPSEKSIILEEYVDGLHFILSLGLLGGWEKDVYVSADEGESSVVSAFLRVYRAIACCQQDFTEKHYCKLFSRYLELAEALDFAPEEIEQAYENKNRINHTRQESNY